MQKNRLQTAGQLICVMLQQQQPGLRYKYKGGFLTTALRIDNQHRQWKIRLINDTTWTQQQAGRKQARRSHMDSRLQPRSHSCEFESGMRPTVRQLCHRTSSTPDV
jgi:hypothetical protein